MESSGYCEVLVKVQTGKKEQIIQKVLWALTFLFLALALFFLLMGVVHLLFWPLALICFIAAKVWQRKFNVEYEYQYLDGSLRIDKIIAMKKRKQFGQFELENLYLAAPEGDERLKPYLSREGLQQLDCSSHNADAPNRYQLVFPNQLLTLEPTEEMVRLMWRMSPHKVVRKKTLA